MALIDSDRQHCRNAHMRFWGEQEGRAAPYTKADLRAAVNAIDDYFDTNAIPMNQALPDNFRTNATQAEKALLFAFVALKRYGWRLPRENG